MHLCVHTHTHMIKQNVFFICEKACWRVDMYANPCVQMFTHGKLGKTLGAIAHCPLYSLDAESFKEPEVTNGLASKPL